MSAAVGLLLLLALPSHGKEAWRGWCETGNQHVTTSGLTSSTTVQTSYPQCTVTVFVHGGGLATIFSDNNGTPLANPFLSQTSGLWIFYAANGRYDVTMTSAGLPQPVTYADILLCDPADASGGSCGTGTFLVGLSINQGTPVQTNLVDLDAGTNITLTQSGSSITINSTGGASLCSASAAGTWDVNPQTCAGEKVIQGHSGNPSTINFNIVPASDQLAQNLYSGIAPGTFNSVSQSQINAGFNAIVGRNIAGLASPGPYPYTLSVVHEETVGTALSAGMQVAMVITGGSSNGPHGANLSCFAESTATTTNSCDGGVGEATDDFGATGTIQSLVGLLGGAFNFANHTSTLVTDFAGEALTCGSATFCNAFTFPDQGTILAQIDHNGNITGVTIGTTVVSALPACVEGELVAISNSTTNTWGATITTGGANHVLGYCDGSNWTVAAK